MPKNETYEKLLQMSSCYPFPVPLIHPHQLTDVQSLAAANTGLYKLFTEKKNNCTTTSLELA